MRPVLAAVLAAFPLAAAAQDCAEGLRPFEHASGTTCIPEDPQRIVATADIDGALPLLDLGAPVIATRTRETEDGTPYVRGVTDILGPEAAQGLESAGAGFPVDVEQVAALGPDLIVAHPWDEDVLSQLAAIAPTVVIPANLPFFEHVGMLADAAGLEDAFAERRAGYEVSLERARGLIADPGAITVSRLDVHEAGVWFYPNWGALDQVIDDLGFARPAVQAEARENITDWSVERIDAFDGDLILTSFAPRFGQTIAMLEDGWMAQGGGLWRRLDGVQAGEHYWYERDLWVSPSFASLERALDGLVLLTAGRDFG